MVVSSSSPEVKTGFKGRFSKGGNRWSSGWGSFADSLGQDGGSVSHGEESVSISVWTFWGLVVGEIGGETGGMTDGTTGVANGSAGRTTALSFLADGPPLLKILWQWPLFEGRQFEQAWPDLKQWQPEHFPLPLHRQHSVLCCFFFMGPLLLISTKYTKNPCFSCYVRACT